MSLITDTWRQLVRRRLWPVAVLLLGALVAVPVLLAKSPAPAPAAPAPAPEAAAPAGGGLAEPIVAMADQSTGDRRHVLGQRKDPFAPPPQPKASPTATATPSGTSTTTTTTTQTGTRITVGSGSGSGTTAPSGSTGGSGGSFPGVSGGGVTPTTPSYPTTPTTPSAPKPKLARGTLTVRWGDASADTLTQLVVKPLDALPDADHPVAIYLGPGKAKGSAVFLVDATVTPEGDASCRPSAADCQKVELRKGDTEFFTVAAASSDTTGTDTTTTTAGGQFELELVDVAGGKAKASRAHRARASHAHASQVRGVVARVVRLLHP
jgi:hypothetical protein